jgi:DNA-binding response OmpR family regulator
MKKNVLIIEDCQLMRHFVAQLLSKKYQVNACDSAEEALAWLCETSAMPDLILTDFNLDTMNGSEFVDEVRNNLGIKHIPILMLSSVKDSVTRLKVLEAGANDYITKPFHPKELELRVATNIEKNNYINQAATTDDMPPKSAKVSPVSTPIQKPKSNFQKQISYLQKFHSVFML